MTDCRPPSEIMRLARLGSAHQTRLSFMRVLLRGMRRNGWRVKRALWQLDDTGVGRAVYSAEGQGQCYSLVAFAHDLPDCQRSDRVIAEAWDATFALMDGRPTNADLDRLAANVPLQEAGRVSDSELVLSRANRSSRLWAHVVERLAAGLQPDAERLAEVGYLMRTTAVYGSGKFGAADHAALAGRPLMDGPFRAEMLAVWLIRAFVCDLVEHMARVTGGARATCLAPALRRSLGIGNSTGLGMAPFLVNHPALLNAWIDARERAFARVRALPASSAGTREGFERALKGTEALLAGWRSKHPKQISKLADLKGDLRRISGKISTGLLERAHPWQALWIWAQSALTIEGQELVLALMLEPHGTLIDDLAEEMGVEEYRKARIDGSMTLSELSDLIRQHFSWALQPDYAVPEGCARFWYVSEAKLEPRLGERHAEAGADLEQPLDIGRSVAALAKTLQDLPGDTNVADFLRAQPEHRRALRRIQMVQSAPYGEIRDNLISADLMPIDMLRCKLAFFGATRFDPRSDRWVRITMFQNAPLPDELHQLPEDDWCLGAQLLPA
ncbi:MAG: hypothetical protein AAF667_06790 [Pseudomonadota bacterium]